MYDHGGTDRYPTNYPNGEQITIYHCLINTSGILLSYLIFTKIRQKQLKRQA
jgi:hypothetical protein